MKKHLILSGIVFFLMIAGLSGCIDAKSVLVNGGEWNTWYFDEIVEYDIHETYIFYQDGKFLHTSTWYEENYTVTYIQTKSEGEYHLSKDKIYLNQDRKQRFSTFNNTWVDTDTFNINFDFKVISSNKVRIGYIEFNSE
jgi:hypothetical protein